MRTICLLALALVLGCAAPEPAADGPPNFLVVLMDDVGVDKIGAYDEHPAAPPTPTIDALAEQGVLFRQAWADPKCSPTRAGLLTGRHGFRYGIGDHLVPAEEWGLPLDEETLPERLWTGGYASAAAGKWHLADRSDLAAAALHPLQSGFRHHAGPLANLGGQLPDGSSQDYFHYRIARDGTLAIRDGYATEDTTDDALRMARDLPEPFLLYVAYNAAHAPYHAPPERLNPRSVPDDASDIELFDAMVQSIDLELGRLLRRMEPDVASRTVVVVMGDNGTPAPVKTGPAAGEPGKGTLHDSGIRVPLVVAGPGVVQGAVSDATVQHTDLFATLTDLGLTGGIDPRDSISFAPLLVEPDRPHLRDQVYTERFRPNGPGVRTAWRRSVRSAGYKLVEDLEGSEELYDLQADPEEQVDLLAEPPLDDEARAALAQLRSRLDGVLGR